MRADTGRQAMWLTQTKRGRMGKVVLETIATTINNVNNKRSLTSFAPQLDFLPSLSLLRFLIISRVIRAEAYLFH
jgi:hypothetical protein